MSLKFCMFPVEIILCKSPLSCGVIWCLESTKCEVHLIGTHVELWDSLGLDTSKACGSDITMRKVVKLKIKKYNE